MITDLLQRWGARKRFNYALDDLLHAQIDAHIHAVDFCLDTIDGTLSAPDFRRAVLALYELTEMKALVAKGAGFKSAETISYSILNNWSSSAYKSRFEPRKYNNRAWMKVAGEIVYGLRIRYAALAADTRFKSDARRTEP